jgi:hypothetical protein
LYAILPIPGDCGYSRFHARNIARTSIRLIDLADSTDKARHKVMVNLVEQMLDLHRKLAAATIPADRTLYERQIDALVYELYGLTGEEIAIVEGR